MDIDNDHIDVHEYDIQDVVDLHMDEIEDEINF
jgi:hypothetical protein